MNPFKAVVYEYLRGALPDDVPSYWIDVISSRVESMHNDWSANEAKSINSDDTRVINQAVELTTTRLCPNGIRTRQ